MRIVLVDPLAYTPPYDNALARALAAEGHAVTLMTSPYPHGKAPAAEGYTREELFTPVSSSTRPRSRASSAASASSTPTSSTSSGCRARSTTCAGSGGSPTTGRSC